MPAAQAPLVHCSPTLQIAHIPIALPHASQEPLFRDQLGILASRKTSSTG